MKQHNRFKILLSMAVIVSLIFLLLLSACGNNGNGSDNETPPAAGNYTETDTDIYNGDDVSDIPQCSDSPIQRNRIGGFPYPYGQIAYQHIAFMSQYLPERIPFSYRELETALWIAETLIEKGYSPDDIVIQQFSYEQVQQYLIWGWTLDLIERLGWFDGHVRREYSQNVILTVPGESRQTIIVGAHYDGVLYPGASDNASGTALLLESAKRMLNHNNYYTIIYIFFGAEEIGLLGAQFFIETLPDEDFDNIVLMINADVLLEGPELTFSAGTIQEVLHLDENPPFQCNAIQVVYNVAYYLNYRYDKEFIAFPDGLGLGSDHLPFLWSGLPVVAFWGITLTEYGFMDMQAGILHTPYDCYVHITTTWPGRIERAMESFVMLLEGILFADFG